MTTASGVRVHPCRPRLLVRGNRKLGDAIFSFSLPAGSTCPGQSPSCARHCYAKHGHYVHPNVRALYARNLELTHSPAFVGLMRAEVRRTLARVVRIHGSGDFYSPEYARKWVDVAHATKETRYFAFTRSWRVPEIREELTLLARLRNVRLWFSCDKDTGVPATQPKRVKLAWMQTSPEDVPPRVDLVFRIRSLRNTTVKRIGLTLVCPVENGITKTTCGQCGFCWQRS
jgi:hypothetical protein